MTMKQKMKERVRFALELWTVVVRVLTGKNPLLHRGTQEKLCCSPSFLLSETKVFNPKAHTFSLTPENKTCSQRMEPKGSLLSIDGRLKHRPKTNLRSHAWVGAVQSISALVSLRHAAAPFCAQLANKSIEQETDEGAVTGGTLKLGVLWTIIFTSTLPRSPSSLTGSLDPAPGHHSAL